jgi:hypothetical protein
MKTSVCRRCCGRCGCRCCRKEITQSVVQPFTTDGPYFNPLLSPTNPSLNPSSKIPLPLTWNAVTGGDMILTDEVEGCSGRYYLSGTAQGLPYFNMYYERNFFGGPSNYVSYWLESDCYWYKKGFLYSDDYFTIPLGSSIVPAPYGVGLITYQAIFMRITMALCKGPKLYHEAESLTYPVPFRTLAWEGDPDKCYLIPSITLYNLVTNHIGIQQSVPCFIEQFLDGRVLLPVEIEDRDCCIDIDLNWGSYVYRNHYSITAAFSNPFGQCQGVISNDNPIGFGNSLLGIHGYLGPDGTITTTLENTCE